MHILANPFFAEPCTVNLSVLRLRTMFVLDTMAKDLKDPLITCHLGTMNSPTRTSVKVSIVTAGYDSVLRTQLVIHVGEKQLTVVCKDGKVLHFSHEPQELRDFILCQISQHQINGVQESDYIYNFTMHTHLDLHIMKFC